MTSVVVVGAGVIGLSTALHLLERFSRGTLDLTVVSDKFSPDITSNKAAALIFPANSQGTTGSCVNGSTGDNASGSNGHPKLSPRNAVLDDRMRRWSVETLRKFHTLHRSKENSQMRTLLEQGYVLFESPIPDPWYKDEVFGFRHVKLDSFEASLLHLPPSVVDIWTFSTYVVETIPYMQWLMDKVKQRGGKFQQKKITSLEELSSYSIIINCTGLGASDVVEDHNLHPVRGQIVSVKAPWIAHWFIYYGMNSYNYLIPRSQDIVLGATSEADNTSETPDPETAKAIFKICESFIPSLCGAEVVGGWAGLRPLRDPIMLQSGDGPGGSLLVHCYGHGGQGFILSWGCAMEIGDIVQNAIISA